jgi:hypothetical protein
MNTGPAMFRPHDVIDFVYIRLVFINLNYNTLERQALRGRTRTVFHLSTPHIILYSFT